MKNKISCKLINAVLTLHSVGSINADRPASAASSVIVNDYQEFGDADDLAESKNLEYSIVMSVACLHLFSPFNLQK